MHFSWVVEFPMFACDEEDGRLGRHAPSVHRAAAAGHGDALATDPGKCRAQAYDLVINGSEAGGGTIRIHDQQMQQQVFALLGHRRKRQARERFGFLLGRLAIRRSAARRHRLGHRPLGDALRRLDNIRDCIAFPKTQRATDLMTDAPGEVDAKQLRELNIKVNKA